MQNQNLKQLKEYQKTIINHYPYPLAYLLIHKEAQNPPTNTTMQLIQDFRDTYIKNLLPSGSGIDSSITIEKVTPTAITLIVPYHHLNESGFYIEWIEYRLKITIDFLGLHISISNTTTKEGDKYHIYDYLHSLFYNAFTTQI